MKDFVALDFKIANQNRHSVCSAAFVFVENGKVVETIYSLINPQEPFNIHNDTIKEVSAQTIIESPIFSDFYNDIKAKLDGKLVVSHGLAFDGSVLKHSVDKYNLERTTNDLLCTNQLASRLLNEQSNYSLYTLRKRYGLKMETKEDSLTKALTVAAVFLQLTDEFQIENLLDVKEKARIVPGKSSTKEFTHSYIRLPKKPEATIEVNKEANTHHRLYGKYVVFTGVLDSLTRTEAKKRLAEVGGIPQSEVRQFTDYVVVGGFEKTTLKGKMSSKEKKAREFVQIGFDLHIITENEFLLML